MEGLPTQDPTPTVGTAEGQVSLEGKSYFLLSSLLACMSCGESFPALFWTSSDHSGKRVEYRGSSKIT